jgi:hypothetical protein
MTDFTNLAALVAQGQSLLDLVKGGHITQLEADNAAKLGEVDAALALKIAQANTAIANATAPIEGKLPNLVLSLNQQLKVSVGSVPDDVIVPSAVTCSVYASISAYVGQRTIGVMDALMDMETDIKEQFSDFDIRSQTNYLKYANGMNIIQIDWDFGTGPLGRVFTLVNRSVGQRSYIPAVGDVSYVSYIKLISGSVGTEGEVGKWLFNSKKVSSRRFSGVIDVGVSALSATGSLLIAFPAVISGNINHPNEIMSGIEL